MSRVRNTHWCHTCLRPIRLRSRYVLCSYCAGEFVQALNETTISNTVNFYTLSGHDFHSMRSFAMDDDDDRSSFASLARVEELYGNGFSFRHLTEELIEQLSSRSTVSGLPRRGTGTPAWLTQNNSCPVCRYKMPTIQGTSQASSRSSRNPFSFFWRTRSSSSSA